MLVLHEMVIRARLYNDLKKFIRSFCCPFESPARIPSDEAFQYA